MTFKILAINGLLLLGYCQLAFSQKGTPQQKSDQLTIASIIFEGITKNKEEFLHKVIKVAQGDILNPHALAKSVRYLNQLNGIAKAEARVDTVAKEIHITFDIQEAMTLFPIVNFGGVTNNFWFQLGFTEANLRGRGQQLTAFYQNNDNRNNFNIYYRAPFLGGSRIGGSLSLLRWASIEPVFFAEETVFYDFDNTSAGATLFYQFENNHFLELGGTVFRERFQKNNRHDGESTAGPNLIEHPKFLIKLIHHYNEIDFHFFYLDGFLNEFRVESVTNTVDNSQFQLVSNESRFFKRIGKTGNLAMRLKLGLSTNTASPFAPFVLDSYFNIRGAGNRIDRGTAAIILNTEYRQTLYERRNWAAQLVAFSDAGTWRSPGGSFDELLNDENFRHFVGGGFRLIYKRAFNAMLRLDYGIDVYNVNQRGFVIGFGQYF